MAKNIAKIKINLTKHMTINVTKITDTKDSKEDF